MSELSDKERKDLALTSTGSMGAAYLLAGTAIAPVAVPVAVVVGIASAALAIIGSTPSGRGR